MFRFHVLRCAGIIACALIILSLVTISGCSQDNPKATSSAGSRSSHDLSGQRVNLLIPWTHAGAAEALAKWFKEESGAIVQIIKIDYHDLLQATYDDFNDVSPQVDVMMIWYVNLGLLVEDRVIANLDEFYTRYRNVLQPDDFIASVFRGHTQYKGRRWAVPFDGDTHLLFYRKSIFAKHNLAPPVTWDNYTAACKLITEKESARGVYGSAIMAHSTPILIISSFMNRLAGYGGILLDDQMHPQVNSTEAVMALTLMVEQSAYALPTPLETDFAVARDAFLQGHVAMVEQWTDIGIMAEDERQSFIRGDWGAVQIPQGSGPKARRATALNAGWPLAISTKAPNRDAAEAFLLFASRPDITLRLNLIPGGGGIDPTRKSVFRSPEFKKIASMSSEMESSILSGDMVVWPNHSQMPELMKVLSGCLVAAMEKRQSPQEALDDCQLKWKAIIQKANQKSESDDRTSK